MDNAIDHGKGKKTYRMACIPVHIKRSRASSIIQPGEHEVMKTTRTLKRHHELKIANDAKSNPK